MAAKYFGTRIACLLGEMHTVKRQKSRNYPYTDYIPRVPRDPPRRCFKHFETIGPPRRTRKGGPQDPPFLLHRPHRTADPSKVSELEGQAGIIEAAIDAIG